MYFFLLTVLHLLKYLLQRSCSTLILKTWEFEEFLCNTDIAWLQGIMTKVLKKFLSFQFGIWLLEGSTELLSLKFSGVEGGRR